MKVQHVNIEYVNQVWPSVEGFLRTASEQQTGHVDYKIEHIQHMVTSGQWVLLVAVDEDKVIHGAATVSFFNRPTARVAFITYIGGRLVSSDDTFKQLCKLCKTFGATKLEGAVNEAVSRLWRKFGFIEKYRVAEAIL